MRHETQRWDKITAYAEIVVAGAGQTGKSPTVAIQRLSDSQWLASGGGSWSAGFATNTMGEPDPANLPGLYRYFVPSARLDVDLGRSGYLMVISEGTTSLLEHVKVDQEFHPGEDITDSARPEFGKFTVSSMLRGVFSFLISSEDDVQTGYVAEAGSTGNKAYITATSLDPSRSAAYVGRLCVHRDNTSGNGEFYNVARIGGIASDGGGTYLTLTNVDGTAYSYNVSSDDYLWVGNSFAQTFVGSVGTDAIDSGSLATSAVEEIADQVWEEALLDHSGTAGSTAEALSNAGSAPTAADVADAVWDEAAGDHSAGATMGGLLNSVPSAADTADAVWDESLAAHTVVGSTGEALATAGSGVTAADIADAVWDEVASDHVAATSMGYLANVTAGLLQYNHRFKNPTYDADDRLLTVDLDLFHSAAAADADAGAFTTVTLEMTYDSDGNLESILGKD